MAHLLFLYINETRSQNFLQCCVVFVAVLLQKWENILLKNPCKCDPIANGASPFEKIRMTYLQITSITAYIGTDAFIKRLEPWTQRNAAEHNVAQGIYIWH